MSKAIQELTAISQSFGQQKKYVIAGGGNTSWKDADHLYIKASGVSLATITTEGFCIMDRKKLDQLSAMSFSEDPTQREEEVKNSLLSCKTNPSSPLRPSVETSLHNLFEYAFVVHTHPTLVNAVLCSKEAEKTTRELFGENALYIPYSDPGFVLFKIIESEILAYRTKYGRDPQVVFIQNHGVFVAANTTAEIEGLYSGIEATITPRLITIPSIQPMPVSEKLIQALPAIRMLLSDKGVKLARAFNNSLLLNFVERKTDFKAIALPFTPDQMVYCQSEYLYLPQFENTDTLVALLEKELHNYRQKRGIFPKLIFIQGEGVIAIDDTAQALDYLQDLVMDFMQIAALSHSFGGPHPMTPEQIDFIEQWEVENYRKKVSTGSRSTGRVGGKIVLITGGAQGFGAGIAEALFKEGANIVVADLNKEKGEALANRLNDEGKPNKSVYVITDVGDPQSVKSMVEAAVRHFGGIDVYVSNAGILIAGGLEEMTPETFDLMTRVNYNALFYGTKYVSAVMQIQHQHRPGYFMDILQINSKSGLKGSRKNFAYAGGKFGGIGLTQSFALELMPFNIKVNAICPGNFFDGPLWSDPEKGLFVQYLKAEKIPGATNLEDVRKYYEAQVPAGRGCTPGDVVKAILYAIDQEYETGQAIPVTGGQEMLR